jgi:PAS domain S-box-containing protein
MTGSRARGRRTLGLRTKIVLFLLPSLVPMVLIVVHGYVSGWGSLRTRIGHLSHAVVYEGTMLLNRDLQQAREKYEEWISEDNKDKYGLYIELGSLGVADVELGRQLPGASEFAVLTLVDLDGKVLAAHRHGSTEGDFLEGAVETAVPGFAVPDRYAIGLVESSLLAHIDAGFRRTYVFRYPTRDSTGAPNGWLLAYLDWRLIRDRMERITQRFRQSDLANSATLIVDRFSGEVLEHTDVEPADHAHRPDCPERERIRPLLAWMRTHENAGRTERFELAGAKEYATFWPVLDPETLLHAGVRTDVPARDRHARENGVDIPLRLEGLEHGSPFAVLALTPEGDFIGEIYRFARGAILLAILGFVASCASVWFAGGKIARRVLRTVTRMQEVTSGGDVRRRVVVDTKDELGDLASSMNSFLDQLQRILEERRESQERYSALYQSAVKVVLEHDFEGRILDANEGALRLLGYPADDVRGRRLTELVRPEDRYRMERATAHVVQHGRDTGTHTHRLLTRNGATVWVESTGVRLDRDGTPVAILRVGHDVTAQRRTEEAYRAVVEHSLQGLAILQDDRFVFANLAYAEVLGTTVERLVALSADDSRELLHPDDRQRVLEDRRRHESGRTAASRSEYRIVRPDGEVRWLETFVSPVEFSGRRALQSAIVDITERRRMEEALRRSEERHRVVSELTSDCAFSYRVDRDGTSELEWVTGAVQRITGYTMEEVQERGGWESLVDPEDRAVARRHAAELRHGEPRTVEYRIATKAGKTRWIVIYARPESGPDGVLRVLGAVQDITEKRRTEEERNRLEDHLRHVQKMDAIGQLAGGVAHDFNNLLTAILGYANMIESVEPTDPTIVKAAEVIERAALRASELTRQLLGFARRGKLQEVAVDLHLTIDEVAMILGRTVDPRKRIVRRYEARRADVRGDPGQIQQVIMNLAVNAADAIPEEGRIVLGTRLVDPDANDGPPWLEVTVEDDGVGIPPEIQDRIFEPFFTTKRQGEGTGMGLAMVYGIVENHGGTVRVESETGRGSTFWIRLPLDVAQAPRRVEPRPVTTAMGSGRVLVVDDEETVRQTLGHMLEALGYEVVLAENGLEGLETYRIERDDIDLVILDIIMPVMNGEDCYRELRRCDPAVRVLLTTGHALEGAAQRLLDQGVEGFVQKPFRMSDLAGAVSRALDPEAVS